MQMFGNLIRTIDIYGKINDIIEIMYFDAVPLEALRSRIGTSDGAFDFMFDFG